jgi:hypothetical protein
MLKSPISSRERFVALSPYRTLVVDEPPCNNNFNSGAQKRAPLKSALGVREDFGQIHCTYPSALLVKGSATYRTDS